MTKLTEKLPRSIEIDGIGYRIDTDYRIMADLETAVCRIGADDKGSMARIISAAISRLFIDIPKAPAEKIIAGMLWYYRCGKGPSGGTFSNSGPCYDYEEDSDYIFAAFMQQYGDDLINSEMHWWEFRAKFISLTDSTKFVKIVQYRRTDPSAIKDRNERARINRLRKIYALKCRKPYFPPDLSERNENIKSQVKKRFEEVSMLSEKINEKE